MDNKNVEKVTQILEMNNTRTDTNDHTVRNTITQPIPSATYSLDEEWVETYINHFGTEPSFF
jgi:hypothetical protein